MLSDAFISLSLDVAFIKLNLYFIRINCSYFILPECIDFSFKLTSTTTACSVGLRNGTITDEFSESLP